MKVWRRLMGRDDKFFDLLEASANEAQGSVRLLVNLVKNPTQVQSLDDFIQARRNDKRITEEISEQLCRTFVTPLEREDIEALSIALYKIPKTVEKFSEKYLLCREHLSGVDLARQIGLLEQATETVAQMVSGLRRRAHLEEVKQQNDRMHYLEGEADRVMMDLVKELYSGRHEPLKVIVVMDLHETIEKIIDRCRDAGNVIFQVVLKYS
jgi:uncharacterized protein